MTHCPYCGIRWADHAARCVGGVPRVDLEDGRGLSGRTISGYRIIGRIGEGGMGTVYVALDNIVEQRLDAVKVLNRDLVVDRERMRREAVTANRVHHPNVCQIYNYVETYDPVSGEDLTLIAMELVRGPTLREVQERSGGRLDLDRAGRVVTEVANALGAVHSSGIIHRDIKPTNIIVTREPNGAERVKLVDFGIAKKQEGGEGQDLTEAGYVAATVHYASPEQLKGQAEPRSDIYALGVVLFELLTGQRPFEAPNQAELYALILDPGVSAPRLRQVRPDLEFPRSLQPILDRALARDPDKRYPTAAEFASDMARFLPGLEATVISPVTELAAAAGPATVPHQAPAVHDRRGGNGRALGRSRVPGRWAVLAPGPHSLLKVSAGVLAAAFVVVLASALGGWNPLDLWNGRDGALDGKTTTSGSPDARARGADDTAAAALADSLRERPARIALNPGSRDLVRGDRFQLRAEVLDEADRPLVDPVVRWWSSGENVAAVDSSGWVTARAPGVAMITAEFRGVTASAEVRVRAPARSTTDVPGPGPTEAACPEPRVLAGQVLMRVDEIHDPSVLRRRRDSAMACWNRGDALSDPDRAAIAYTIGRIEWQIRDGCSPEVIRWYDQAVRFGGSDSRMIAVYRGARRACDGGSP